MGARYLTSKICVLCKVEKLIIEFYGHERRCKTCSRVLAKDHLLQQKMGRTHYMLHPEKYRDQFLRRYYGITFVQYSSMFKAQKGLCALCLQPETATINGKLKGLCVDHDHKTGVIRGLLCSKCNHALARFDAVPEWASRVFLYLQPLIKRKAA